MCILFPPYFDHDAFMHHPMHVLDAPAHGPEENTSPGISQSSTRVRLPTSICRHWYQEGQRNMLRIGSVTGTPLSLLPTSLCRLRSRHWAPSTVRVASSCWNLVVVELGCPTIHERLFSCFKDCQYAFSALTPSLIEAPSHRTPRMRKSLLDYITVT